MYKKNNRSAMYRMPRTVGHGPFEARDESLQQYTTPDWFRNAKLGIWAHWGPQGVPMVGDWYARNMYMEGSDTYNHHLSHYGHPSEVGFKDIFPLWKAEKFDPDALMDKYVKAGAKYFVALGVHVDNFDCWDSNYHRWNSTELGPKMDIVGTWQKAAKKHGLKFGVTEHLSNYYYWYGPSKLADRQGPYKDVLYDGSDPELADLYFSTPHESDAGVYTTPKVTPDAWNHEWYHRMKDLIDQYDPDLFYIDGGIPFGEVGRELMAYYYNHNIEGHGTQEGVFNIKNIKELCDYVPGTATLDLERGVAKGITEEPWQIDTCVGDWFYKENILYKTSQQVIEFLIDTVSKNGNLLLNIPLRPDGTLDDQCEGILDDLGGWMEVNSEAIYDTRPWKVYGENIRTQVKATESKNEDDFAMADNELRYTIKGDKLYIFFFKWPANNKLLAKSLADERVKSAKLLGGEGDVGFIRGDQGCTFTLAKPYKASQAFVLEVQLT